ncbi:hypothetical protein [Alteromonas lipolytica]|uniref:Uncharacterized protein n=1 Tax=Alteromonas lipolytica TaxID=1856405 RepID=A0A1E8FJQ7_9ALTE|nr:hypothetical protein [Alteromonas lipolytica]OFI35986.1 hypothetical protein BFC17_09925 [Alteromonas lipolytica]GGF71912.1 hypothetical protein GCM10011338_25180 [Alteromonas lipolytica]
MTELMKTGTQILWLLISVISGVLVIVSVEHFLEFQEPVFRLLKYCFAGAITARVYLSLKQLEKRFDA